MTQPSKTKLVTLNDGTEVEIRALTSAEASRIEPNLFTWDETTARKVAAIAIVKPTGVLERNLSKDERDRIFRATGSAWLEGWMQAKKIGSRTGGPPRQSSGRARGRMRAERETLDEDNTKVTVKVFANGDERCTLRWSIGAKVNLGRHTGDWSRITRTLLSIDRETGEMVLSFTRSKRGRRESSAAGKR